jgi:hypothetical protein
VVPAYGSDWDGMSLSLKGSCLLDGKEVMYVDESAEIYKRTDSVQAYDFRSSGAYEPMSTGEGFYLTGAEYLSTTCVYKTHGRNIVFGLGSDDEMCIDFLFYYPKGALSSQCSDAHYSTNLQNLDSVRKFGSTCEKQPPACVIESDNYYCGGESYQGSFMGDLSDYPTPESCYAECSRASHAPFMFAEYWTEDPYSQPGCWCTLSCDASESVGKTTNALAVVLMGRTFQACGIMQYTCCLGAPPDYRYEDARTSYNEGKNQGNFLQLNPKEWVWEGLSAGDFMFGEAEWACQKMLWCWSPRVTARLKVVHSMWWTTRLCCIWWRMQMVG